MPLCATAPFPANRNSISSAVSRLLLPLCCLGASSVALTISTASCSTLAPCCHAALTSSPHTSTRLLGRYGAPIAHATHHTNNLHSSMRTCVPQFGSGLTQPAPPTVLIGPSSPLSSLAPSIQANSTMSNCCRSPSLRLKLTSPYTSTPATRPPLLVLQYRWIHPPPRPFVKRTVPA